MTVDSSLRTSLAGRLRNTHLPKSHALMPVFEAIVNSIHAIEDRTNFTEGKIVLKVHRETQENLSLGKKNRKKTKITGFTIIDNGCGFNEENFKSFCTLDSEYKIARGSRGIGRLMWLKVFNNVRVDSSFLDKNGQYVKREFIFTEKNGINDEKTLNEAQEYSTRIHLTGINSSYQQNILNSTKDIAKKLLEHILWYYVRDSGVPSIIIEDDEIGIIDLAIIYSEHMHSQVFSESIMIKKHKFELIHIKFNESVNKRHQIAFCAANRLVSEENIQGRIPGLYNKLYDDKGEFTYTCYITSSYLDENVRSERTSFNFDETVEDLLSDISLNNIREKILERTSDYLKDVLTKNIEQGRERVNTFIDDRAPKYKPLLKYFDKYELILDPDKSDQEIDIYLYEKLQKLEMNMMVEGQVLMSPSNLDSKDEYQQKLAEYLEKVESVKKSDLANYVFHRKIILDLLSKAIERQEDGKYAREDLIHEFIMPMRSDSNDFLQHTSNLWLVDERLAFHHYLASDKPISSYPISDSNSQKEPDLLGLKIIDNPILVNDGNKLPLASITVIELKRPMRNDMSEGVEKNPIQQALQYLEKIREGKVKTISGRPIPDSHSIPGYCYILCDLTPTMQEMCKMSSLQITADAMGYFGYNSSYKAYIEVISFDKLVNAAKERNRIFFDTLGLPNN